MELVTLQIEVNRAHFAVNRLVAWLNEDLHEHGIRTETPDMQARIQRAYDRLVGARQDLAAIGHAIWPEAWPHPSDAGATHHWGFPRETQREAPYATSADLFKKGERNA